MSMTIGMDWQKRTITIHQKPYLINLIDNRTFKTGIRASLIRRYEQSVFMLRSPHRTF